MVFFLFFPGVLFKWDPGVEIESHVFIFVPAGPRNLPDEAKPPSPKAFRIL